MNQVTTARRTQTEQEMFSLISGHQSSNMNVKEFCALHHLSEARYYYWRKKYLTRQEAGIQQNQSFALLQVSETEIGATTGLFAEVNGIKLYREVPAAYLKGLL